MRVKKSQLQKIVREVILQEEKKKGLWHNINKNKKAGKKPNHPNSKAYKAAKKAGQKINKANETEEESEDALAEAIVYHLDANVGVDQNVFRPGSANFFKLFREVRKLYNLGLYEALTEDEIELLESDVGMFAELNGKVVPLDFPMQESKEYLLEAEYQGKKVELNEPKRGEGGKSYVYVNSGKKDKDGKMKVKKVSFGSSMADAMGDSEAHRKRRKNYGERHNCSDKDDKTKAGYWSCRATKFFGRDISGWW